MPARVLLAVFVLATMSCGRAHRETAAGVAGDEMSRTDDEAAGVGAPRDTGDATGGDSAGPSGFGTARSGVAGTVGTAVGPDTAGIAGTGTGGVGEPPPAGAESGGGSGASQILNPSDCDTPLPFVLSIDPSGDSGHVSGWLDSTARVVFVDRLPHFERFDPAVDAPAGAIALWWSIARFSEATGESALFFYGGFTPEEAVRGEGSATQLVVVEGATSFDDVDPDALMFGMGHTPAVGPGTIVAFRNVDTLDTMALRLDSTMAATEAVDFTRQGECVAVEVSWTFAL